jgi:hypothetical protein
MPGKTVSTEIRSWKGSRRERSKEDEESDLKY